MRPHRRRRDGSSTTRMATSRSTTRWCAWRRISPSAIRSSTGRAISAISTAITPPPSLHRGAADRGRAAAARGHRRGRGRFPRDLRPDQTRSRSCCPAAFPNLLANGSQGIAVGMATSIPPHNAAELCDAALYLIKRARRDLATTLAHSCQGRISRPAASSSTAAPSIAETYRTGRGSFRVRARWEKEDTGPGTWNIVITEIPVLGAEIPPDREDRRAAAGQEAAAARRRARRIARRISAWCWSRAPAPSIRSS